MGAPVGEDPDAGEIVRSDMCLESDSNRHYAVFETALSTVGVPRLTPILPEELPIEGREENISAYL